MYHQNYRHSQDRNEGIFICLTTYVYLLWLLHTFELLRFILDSNFSTQMTQNSMSSEKDHFTKFCVILFAFLKFCVKQLLIEIGLISVYLAHLFSEKFLLLGETRGLESDYFFHGPVLKYYSIEKPEKSHKATTIKCLRFKNHHTDIYLNKVNTSTLLYLLLLLLFFLKLAGNRP